MKALTKKDGTDERHRKLSSLIKNIFSTKVNSTEKINDDCVCVIRGEGREIGKCKFTDLYRADFSKLFEYTFIHQNCEFKYKGVQKADQKFDRQTAVANAVLFFNKHNVDLGYFFYSQAEQALFSRLIYKYISWLLEVLFYDYKCEGVERDSLVEKKYEKAFSRIKSEINTNDIIDLIYSEAQIGDIEQIIDSRYDKAQCNIAYLIDTYNYKDGFLRLKNEVICNMQGYDQTAISNIIMNKADLKYQIFPFKKNIRFAVAKDTYNLSIRIWKNICREMYIPRYFWFVTIR